MALTPANLWSSLMIDQSVSITVSFIGHYFTIDLHRIRSESEQTWRSALSSSESILLASARTAGGRRMFSSLQPGKIVLSFLCKYHSFSLLAVFFRLHTHHHRLCSGASAAALQHESHLEIGRWRTSILSCVNGRENRGDFCLHFHRGRA